jgi:hypothetical protein
MPRSAGSWCRGRRSGRDREAPSGADARDVQQDGLLHRQGDQRGATYEAGKLFEEFLNQRLKSKTIRVHVVFIPVSRDRIFKDLAEGEATSRRRI